MVALAVAAGACGSDDDVGAAEGVEYGGGEEARPTFVRLRELSERLRVADPRLGPGLSMGMTDDYEAALEEGSTVVRVGRALFGERPATA